MPSSLTGFEQDSSQRVTITGSDIVTYTDYSGTITLGGTAQQLIPANTLRRGFWLQNNSSGDLWINYGVNAVASQPSMKIPAGAYFEVPVAIPTSAVSIIGATTSQAFSCREW